MNRSFSLRRLLTRSLFQTALLGIPALSLVLGACTEQIGGSGTTTGGSASSSGGAGGQSGSTTGQGGSTVTVGQGGSGGCPPSMASGTGYFIEVAHPCFPWADVETTGGGGMGGGAGTGGGGGNAAALCPDPNMAPASWGLDMYPDNFVQGPYNADHLDGKCCYAIELFCV